jgi:hypothetical protein
MSITEKEREDTMDKSKVNDALKAIWGSETYHVVLVFTPDGRLFAECDFTGDRRRLTESNFEAVLNDMFYDYCVENAAWMGVS